VREPSRIKSYKLVPDEVNGFEPRPSPGVRRFQLARVGANRRSALGQDRHERMERVAGLGEEPPPKA